MRKMKCIEELVSLEMLIDFNAVKVTIVSFLALLLKVWLTGPSVLYPVGGGNAPFFFCLFSPSGSLWWSAGASWCTRAP